MTLQRTQDKHKIKQLSVHKAKNWKEKVQGLIGSKEAKNFLLKTHFGIHTIGLKFPIDVLILDKDNHVRAMKQNLKRNNIFLWNPKYDTVIELPSGEINKHKIEIEDKIKLDFDH